MTKFQVPLPPDPADDPLFSPRGAKLATRFWQPAASTKRRGICIMVPGGGWHSGYYEPLALLLNQQGFVCSSYDTICSGYSENEPGTPKGCMHFHSFDDLVEDVVAAIVWTKKSLNDPKEPVFLLGESFGGLQVLATALAVDLLDANSIKISGVITLGAALEINPVMLPPKPVIVLLSFLSKYYPRLPMPATDFGSSFDEAFGEKEWAKVARQDPAVIVSLRPTLAGAVGTITTGAAIAAQSKQFSTPLLAIHGIHDCRTMCDAMRRFVDQAGAKASGVWVEGTTGHQLLQDTEAITRQVTDAITVWLNEQTINKN